MSQTGRAIFWMFGAISAFTSMAIAGRAVSSELDTFEIMLFRSILGVIVVLGLGAFSGTLGQINRGRSGLHLLRNLCHFAGQNLWFYAIASIPLAQVFALEFTTPIWVILLSPLLLNERLTRMGLFTAMVGFAGIMIVAQPQADNLSLGLGAGALCAVFFALTAVFTRKLTRTESMTSIMFYLTTLQVIFGLICAGYDGDITVPSRSMLPWIILIGFAGLVAHFCLTKALSLAPATVVMPIDFARLPIIAVFGMLLYQEPFDPWVFIGAAIIFAANYANITSNTAAKGKYVTTEKQENF